MDSRMDRYEEVDIENYQRSKKNASLYKEVYGNYADFEDLPIPENTNEIDIENFKTLVGSRIDRKKERNEESFDTLEEEVIEEETNNEEKVYDINELLEKAKIENAKIKKEVVVNKNVPNYLANLESDKNTKEIITKYDNDNYDDDLPIVKTTEYNTNIINVGTANLSLDILSDLKPSGDTFISEPINEELEQEEKEFYSGKIEFTENDFSNEDDDEFYEENNHTFLKVLLVIVGISCLITACYFILTETGIIKF